MFSPTLSDQEIRKSLLITHMIVMLRVLEVTAAIVQSSHSLEADHFIEKGPNLGVRTELREASCVVRLQSGIFPFSFLPFFSVNHSMQNEKP